MTATKTLAAARAEGNRGYCIVGGGARRLRSNSGGRTKLCR
jgi:hypothetical protein